MIRRIVWSLAALALLGASAVSMSLSAASAATGPLFGVNTHFMWHGPSRTANELSWMRAAGITTARFDLTWGDLEPARGYFDPAVVSKLDNVLEAMQASGVQPIIMVLSTPGWANNNAGRWVPPTNMQDYADALRYLAARYAARSPGVVWEVWNEPNDPHFWQPSPNAGQYAALLRAAYKAIKDVDPAATVLGGSILFNDRKYLDHLYAAGARGYFDALSLHPYTTAGIGPSDPDSAHNGYFSYLLTAPQMEQEMAKYGDPNKPIWITEMGWPTSDVGDSTRALYMRQAVDLVRSWPYVRSVCPYVLDQIDDPSYGLVSSTGASTSSWLGYSAAVAASAPFANAHRLARRH